MPAGGSDRAEAQGSDPEALIEAVRQGAPGSRERLIVACRRLVERIADRLAGGPQRALRDDARSVALIALDEAIDAYRPSGRGSFRAFAARRVFSRVVDFLRSQRRGEVLWLEAPVPGTDGDGEWEEPPLARAAAIDRWRREEEARTWAEAFTRFEARLHEFGLTLEDLLDAAPRHQDTRLALARAARRAAARHDLIAHLVGRRQLPLNEMERVSGLSRKLLERWRRYLVALLVILSDPELEPMRSYVPGGACDDDRR